MNDTMPAAAKEQSLMNMVAARNGAITLVRAPFPAMDTNMVLAETAYSAISPGTELAMAKRSGDTPVPLGYSASGIVLDTEPGVDHVRRGDRVAVYEAPYVCHAERLAVPKTLVVPVPEAVTTEDAAAVGLGAIAGHALRQANVTFGDIVVVIGLGILGQITARMAAAAGCDVLATDLLASRREAASRMRGVRAFGTWTELREAVDSLTGGRGADAVLICAGAKDGSLLDPSLDLLRLRGRMIVVGDMELRLSRVKMFQKEAALIVSKAGGPGRYDEVYERLGVDYPAGYVRWTEGRNMEAYIRLLANGHMRVADLFTHRIGMDMAAEAFSLYADDPENVLGVVLTYGTGSGANVGQAGN